MKQPNASSFATLRMSTVLAILWALPVGRVSAIPIQMPLTGGRITMDILPPQGFISLDVDLENPGRRFRLTNSSSGVGFADGLGITGGPNTCCTARLSLTYSFDFVSYLDADYHAFALVNLFTSSIDLGPVPPGGDTQPPRTEVTLPFTLSGTVHGQASFFPYPSVDFEVFGRGTVGAVFESSGGLFPEWQLQHISYDLVPPVPEPATWVLVGSGLLGVARRRSTRLNR